MSKIDIKKTELVWRGKYDDEGKLVPTTRGLKKATKFQSKPLCLIHGKEMRETPLKTAGKTNSFGETINLS